MQDSAATNLFDDVTFAAPPAWQRRTIVAFAEPNLRERRNPATAVFVREPLPEGETVHSLSEKHLLEASALSDFRVLHHRVTDRDGLVRVELAYEWIGDEGPVQQTSIFIVTPGEHGSIVTNATTTCAREDAAEMLPVFAALVESLRPAMRPRAISGVERTYAADTEPCLPEFPMPGCRRSSRPTRPASQPSVDFPLMPPPARMPDIPMPRAKSRL